MSKIDNHMKIYTDENRTAGRVEEHHCSRLDVCKEYPTGDSIGKYKAIGETR